MTNLTFSDYKYDGYSQIPPRALNGGLYTGEPFKKNSPYGNVPIIPDTGYLIHYNLRSANPPPGAIYQYPGGNTRPGNNFTNMIGISINNKYNVAVNEGVCKGKNDGCKCRKCSFSKYAYI